MVRKGTLSFVIMLTLVFSLLLSSTVFADTVSDEKLKLMVAAGEVTPIDSPSEDSVKIKKDTAVEMAKKFLENASLYELGSVSLNPKWSSKGSMWNIEFYRKQTPGGNANMGIDADNGKLLNFNIWEGYETQQNFVAKITRSEAKVKAEEFIKAQLREDMSSYELQKEDPYAYNYRMGGVKEQVIYNFNYIKKINGVPFTNYNISIGVDGTSGKVRNFYTNPLDTEGVKFPSTENILNPEKAMEKYKQSVNVALQYISTYEQNNFGPSKQKIILGYVPTTYINMVDAVSGKIVNYDGSSIDLSDKKLQEAIDNPVPMEPDAKELDAKAVTETEARSLAEELKEQAEEILGVKFINGSDRVYYQTRVYSGQDDVWNFNWNNDNEKGNAHFSVSINSKTGHITSMNLGVWDRIYDMKMASGEKMPEVKENITWKQGRDKAVELVKKLVPNQYGYFVDNNLQEPVFTEDSKKFMREYNYSFTRVVNKLRYRDNNMNVSIDRETGEVRNFYLNWNDVDFPSTEKVISREEAANKYFEGTEARLTYYLNSTYDNVSRQPKFDTTAKLVYNFNTKGYMYGGNLVVDAASGKLLDWSGREFKIDTSSGEPQLQDHWAKRSIELLIAQGIIKNPYVEYESSLTKEEAVKMLALAKGMWNYDTNVISEPSFKDVPKDSEYFIYVENAVKQKIIEKGGEFKGDEKITREEYAKLLANLMGYSDIAKNNNIFKTIETGNVSEEYTGYVAVCSALGTLPVKEGEAFDGKSEVSYAEAAASLYKALSLIK